MNIAGKIAAALILATSLGGCAGGQLLPTPAAKVEVPTKTTWRLNELPAPVAPVDVAVYEFPDLTGQAKPNENFAEYSRAVTQGGAPILVDVLKSVSYGQWFRVVERNGLKNLVQERTLIENTQRAYSGSAAPLPPVRFAGVIIEGAVVGYDSNESTGGAGAKYLGIGGDVTHRSDLVTVALRAVSVQNGEVLVSTTASKQIYSTMVRGGAYKFVVPTELLEVEAGFSLNDPGQLAVRESLEAAVLSMIIKGLQTGLWDLPDAAEKRDLIEEYYRVYKRKSGTTKKW